jgi:hypothetical protein
MGFKFLDSTTRKDDCLIIRDKKNKFAVKISEMYFLTDEEKETLGASSNIFMNFDIKKGRGCQLGTDQELKVEAQRLIVDKFGPYGKKICVPENLFVLH